MSTGKKKVTRFILDALKKEGIDHVFIVPGGMIEPFLPEFSEAGMDVVVACHEAGAAYMADGYARASGNFGVCMGIGGPGVTNMLTAISAAKADRSPVLVIGGSVPQNWEGLAPFQDSSQTGIPDVELMRPVTECQYKLELAEQAPHFLEMVLRSMLGVANSPGFLSVPYYIQDEEIEAEYRPVLSRAVRSVDRNSVGELLRAFKEGKKIAFMAGNGTVLSGASESLRAFAKKYDIPVVTTLRAKGAISEQDEMSFGIYGMGGSLQANAVVMGDENEGIERPDVLVLLGGNFNENNTFMSYNVQPLKKLIRVDHNTNLQGQNRYQETMVWADIQGLFDWLEENADRYDEDLKASADERREWMKQIRKGPYHDTDEDRRSDRIPLHPARVIAALREAAPVDALMVSDSGANTYFTGHNWTSHGPGQYFLLSTTGPMGYGIAMAIGVQMARPKQQVIAVMGDGDMGMHGLEYLTAIRYRLPLLIVILDNRALGNVYLALKKNDMGEAAESLTDIPGHDWPLFAKAMGGDGELVENPSGLDGAFKRGLASQVPYIIQVRVDKNATTPNTQEPDMPGPPRSR